MWLFVIFPQFLIAVELWDLVEKLLMVNYWNFDAGQPEVVQRGSPRKSLDSYLNYYYVKPL